jgi:hypothetical protein
MKDELKTDILKIEALEKEYNAVLNQYEETYKNCNDELQQNVNNKQRSFQTFNNRAYWGTSGLSQGTVGAVTDCENMCATNAKCTGATFNTVNKYCWTRTGTGTLSPTSSSNVAILPTVKACAVTLNALNKQLIKINRQITELIETTNSQLVAEKSNRNNSKQQLNIYYAQLLKERLQMAKILEDQKTIDEDTAIQSLYVSSQSNTFRLWSLLACILLLVIINKLYGKEPSIFKVSFILMIVLLIASFSLNTGTGFMTWLILILIIVFMKMGIIPGSGSSSNSSE